MSGDSARRFQLLLEAESRAGPDFRVVTCVLTKLGSSHARMTKGGTFGVLDSLWGPPQHVYKQPV